MKLSLQLSAIALLWFAHMAATLQAQEPTAPAIADAAARRLFRPAHSSILQSSRGTAPLTQAADARLSESTATLIPGDTVTVHPTAFQAGRQSPQSSVGSGQSSNLGQFTSQFANRSYSSGIGLDLYSAPEFESALVISSGEVAMKIGGYVKADFIHDFDPIDSTDSFVTTSIPVGAPHRTNSRFHARQTRMSFDTRWTAEGREIKVFVETDFFSPDDQWRLRHAYGEVGRFLVGQTWTTFTDISAAPPTIDIEGSVASVFRRQAQARYTNSIFHEDITYSIAVEDTFFNIDVPEGVSGEARTPSPDFVSRIRLNREWGQFQSAFLLRKGGFQPVGEAVETGVAWGFNFTGVVLLSESDKAYYQITFGNGIGSYRGLPDVAPVSLTDAAKLDVFAWMTGFTHDWNDSLSSNFTYAQSAVENLSGQKADDIHMTSYLAANLVWTPMERVTVGAEYLYGTRENFDGGKADANRIQAAVVFTLP